MSGPAGDGPPAPPPDPPPPPAQQQAAPPSGAAPATSPATAAPAAEAVPPDPAPPGPGPPNPGPPNPGRGKSEFQWLQSGFEWGLVLSRGLVLIPVVVLVIAAAASFVYGASLFVWSAIHTIADPFPVGNRIGIFMLVVDLYLVGATLLISAIGLYELFISRVDPDGGERSHLPGWLVMNDLNDLKGRVVSMLILVTAVTFVDEVVDFPSGHDILYLGIAAAVVIAALTAFLRYGAGGREGS